METSGVLWSFLRTSTPASRTRAARSAPLYPSARGSLPIAYWRVEESIVDGLEASEVEWERYISLIVSTTDLKVY